MNLGYRTSKWRVESGSWLGQLGSKPVALTALSFNPSHGAAPRNTRWSKLGSGLPQSSVLGPPEAQVPPDFCFTTFLKGVQWLIPWTPGSFWNGWITHELSFSRDSGRDCSGKRLLCGWKTWVMGAWAHHQCQQTWMSSCHRLSLSWALVAQLYPCPWSYTWAWGHLSCASHTGGRICYPRPLQLFHQLQKVQGIFDVHIIFFYWIFPNPNQSSLGIGVARKYKCVWTHVPLRKTGRNI